MGLRDISYKTRIQPCKQRKIIVTKEAEQLQPRKKKKKEAMLMLRMRIIS